MDREDFLQYLEDNQLELTRQILSSCGVGTWVRDNIRALGYVDSSSVEIWGMEGVWEPDQWIDVKEMLTMTEEIDPADVKKVQDFFSGDLQVDKVSVRHTLKRPDGQIRYVEMRSQVQLRGEDGVPIAITGVHIDITDLVTFQQKAYIDPLTMVYTRNKLYDDFPEYIPVEGEGRLAILFDLDLFKEINDLHGHVIGDEALKAFAKVLRSSIRDDDEVYRLGGDEFFVVTGAMQEDGVESFLDRIQKSVTDVQRPVRISSTLGALYISKSIGLDRAFTLADKELYRAKNRSRGKYSLRVLTDSEHADA